MLQYTIFHWYLVMLSFVLNYKQYNLLFTWQQTILILVCNANTVTDITRFKLKLDYFWALMSIAQWEPGKMGERKVWHTTKVLRPAGMHPNHSISRPITTFYKHNFLKPKFEKGHHVTAANKHESHTENKKWQYWININPLYQAQSMPYG